MNWERISNLIGVSLLGLCFIASVGRMVATRFQQTSSHSEDKVVLRIAHYQLETGVREALEAISKSYSEIHPEVQIIQIPIPEAIFKNWRTTQLVGETPPDLIEMGFGNTDEQLARYFLPLSEIANETNPYNKGTYLSDKPLRETFLDGMQSGYSTGLAEYYGVPATSGTFRVFYNLDLLKEITGSAKLPVTYEEFVALCNRIEKFTRQTGRNVVPIGGSLQNANILMDFLFTTQTQKLLQERINPPGLLTSSASAVSVTSAYWKGIWGFDSPEIRSGLSLVRETTLRMQPGFAQLKRDDALFHFAQGSSVLIPSGTWDAISLRSLSPFPVGAGMLPLPDEHHPVYGRFAYGRVSEVDRGTGFVLAVPRAGGHLKHTLDFLKFLASARTNALWTQVSKWPPAVTGVTPAEGAEEFMPQPGGFPGGFPINNLGADSGRLYQTNLFQLIGPNGSVDRFVAAVKSDYGKTLESDLRRSLESARDTLRRSDPMLASLEVRKKSSGENSRLDLQVQAECANERSAYQIMHALRTKP